MFSLSNHLERGADNIPNVIGGKHTTPVSQKNAENK